MQEYSAAVISDPKSSRLSVIRHSDDDGEVLEVTGEIDLHSASLLEAELRTTSASETLALDFAEVSFLDSAGLRALVSAHERLAAEGVVLTVRNPSVAARRVIEITGLADHLGTDKA